MLKIEAEKIRQWQVQTEMNTKKMVRKTWHNKPLLALLT